MVLEEKNSTIHQKEKLLSELQQLSAQAADYKKQLAKVSGSIPAPADNAMDVD